MDNPLTSAGILSAVYTSEVELAKRRTDSATASLTHAMSILGGMVMAGLFRVAEAIESRGTA